jgi:hypothetical protein
MPLDLARIRRLSRRKPRKLTLSRDCHNCYTPVPIATVRGNKLTELPEPAECPHCGAPFPLR